MKKDVVFLFDAHKRGTSGIVMKRSESVSFSTTVVHRINASNIYIWSVQTSFFAVAAEK